jgi:hypothetical protein
MLVFGRRYLPQQLPAAADSARLDAIGIFDLAPPA